MDDNSTETKQIDGWQGRGRREWRPNLRNGNVLKLEVVVARPYECTQIPLNCSI